MLKVLPKFIVTSQQLLQGWSELRDDVIIRHEYEVVRKLRDGNYEVVYPPSKTLFPDKLNQRA